MHKVPFTTCAEISRFFRESRRVQKRTRPSVKEANSHVITETRGKNERKKAQKRQERM